MIKPCHVDGLSETINVLSFADIPSLYYKLQSTKQFVIYGTSDYRWLRVMWSIIRDFLYWDTHPPWWVHQSIKKIYSHHQACIVDIARRIRYKREPAVRISFGAPKGTPQGKMLPWGVFIYLLGAVKPLTHCPENRGRVTSPQSRFGRQKSFFSLLYS